MGHVFGMNRNDDDISSNIGIKARLLFIELFGTGCEMYQYSPEPHDVLGPFSRESYLFQILRRREASLAA